jgi:hypothetical protein
VLSSLTLLLLCLLLINALNGSVDAIDFFFFFFFFFFFLERRRSLLLLLLLMTSSLSSSWVLLIGLTPTSSLCRRLFTLNVG